MGVYAVVHVIGKASASNSMVKLDGSNGSSAEDMDVMSLFF